MKRSINTVLKENYLACVSLRSFKARQFLQERRIVFPLSDSVSAVGFVTDLLSDSLSKTGFGWKEARNVTGSA